MQAVRIVFVCLFVNAFEAFVSIFVCVHLSEREGSECLCECVFGLALVFSVSSSCRRSLSICLSSWRVSHTHIHTHTHTHTHTHGSVILTSHCRCLSCLDLLYHMHAGCERARRKFDREKKNKGAASIHEMLILNFHARGHRSTPMLTQSRWQLRIGTADHKMQKCVCGWLTRNTCPSIN